ncbi:MAG: ribbon-helix-helix domain-containing protein [Nanoarchaeota archaeon]|nr:ribbon-helix-helix domain-containing protein [Nanoarchaeota archaeon]
MKVKISISLDAETLAAIESTVAAGTFRNKSHCIEYATQHLLEQHHD